MVYFATGKKAPTEKQIRKAKHLPDGSKFLGWAVHTPDEDGFLLKVYGSDNAIVRTFGGTPETAAKYTNPNVAARIVDDLKYPATLAALFDIGEGIASISVAGNQFSEFAPD